MRVGFMHLSVEEFTQSSGGKFLRAARDLSFSVRRGPDVARIKALTGTDEAGDGAVVGVFMQQRLWKVEAGIARPSRRESVARQSHRSTVQFRKVIPWNHKVIGNFGELNILKVRRPKPGDKFDYVIYEPIVNAIVTIRVKAEAYEVIADRSGIGRSCLRLAAVPDKIADVQLPSQLLWVDQDFEIRRSTSAMPGMGYLVVDRSSKADATQPLNPNQLPDIMERQSIKLSQTDRQSAPARNQIVYRITMTADDEPAKTFAQDNRQVDPKRAGQEFRLGCDSHSSSRRPSPRPLPPIQERNSPRAISSSQATTPW